MMAGHYAHARPMKRGGTPKLRAIRAGCCARSTDKKRPLRQSGLLAIANRIYRQKREDKTNVYSVPEPETMAVAKVRVAMTSQDGWLLGAVLYKKIILTTATR
jgi:hypothetical protein